MATILFFDLSRDNAFEGLKRLMEGSGNFHLRYQRAVSAEPEAVRAQLVSGLGRAEVDAVLLACQAEALALSPELVHTLASSAVSVPFIVAFEACDQSDLCELLQAGASEFLLPPFDGPHVLPRLSRLLGPWTPEGLEARALKEKLGLKEFVGEDPALLRELRKIEQSAGCDLCTLLVGETGTGKELCARGPFII